MKQARALSTTFSNLGDIEPKKAQEVLSLSVETAEQYERGLISGKDRRTGLRESLRSPDYRTALLSLVLQKKAANLTIELGSLSALSARSGVPLFTTIRKVGKKNVLRVLVALLEIYVPLFPGGDEIDGNALAMIGIGIISDYYEMTIEELVRCFTLAQRGRYGKTYKISSQEVLIWVGKYWSTLDEELAQDYRLNKDEEVGPKQRPRSAPGTIEALSLEASANAYKDEFSKISKHFKK